MERLRFALAMLVLKRRHFAESVEEAVSRVGAIKDPLDALEWRLLQPPGTVATGQHGNLNSDAHSADAGTTTDDMVTTVRDWVRGWRRRVRDTECAIAAGAEREAELCARIQHLEHTMAKDDTAIGIADTGHVEVAAIAVQDDTRTATQKSMSMLRVLNSLKTRRRADASLSPRLRQLEQLQLCRLLEVGVTRLADTGAATNIQAVAHTLVQLFTAVGDVMTCETVLDARCITAALFGLMEPLQAAHTALIRAYVCTDTALDTAESLHALDLLRQVWLQMACIGGPSPVQSPLGRLAIYSLLGRVEELVSAIYGDTQVSNIEQRQVARESLFYTMDVLQALTARRHNSNNSLQLLELDTYVRTRVELLVEAVMSSVPDHDTLMWHALEPLYAVLDGFTRSQWTSLELMTSQLRACAKQ